jgi:hypothetical protein
MSYFSHHYKNKEHQAEAVVGLDTVLFDLTMIDQDYIIYRNVAKADLDKLLQNITVVGLDVAPHGYSGLKKVIDLKNNGYIDNTYLVVRVDSTDSSIDTHVNEILSRKYGPSKRTRQQSSSNNSAA